MINEAFLSLIFTSETSVFMPEICCVAKLVKMQSKRVKMQSHPVLEVCKMFSKPKSLAASMKPATYACMTLLYMAWHIEKKISLLFAHFYISYFFFLKSKTWILIFTVNSCHPRQSSCLLVTHCSHESTSCNNYVNRTSIFGIAWSVLQQQKYPMFLT